MESRFWEEGYNDYLEGADMHNNPYEFFTWEHEEWYRGWLDASNVED